MKPTIKIASETDRARAHAWVEKAPIGYSLVFHKDDTRTLDQNAKLWPMLTDIRRQVDWHGLTLSNEDWKNMFTASLKNQRTVPGIDGGFVVLGSSTSAMDKETFSELIDLIDAFGSQRGVEWSEPK